MNYFIDFIPDNNFIKIIENINEQIDDNIVLNMYIKKLPAMNINKIVYCDQNEAIEYIKSFKEKNIKINLMLDTFCFGNKEFTKKGKEIFEILDNIFKYEIDYVTVTNNFFFNYIKRRYSNIKIIISEYSEVNNVQKIYRYLENIKADYVKVDLKLSLDNELMQYVKDNFNSDNIHIDMNKFYYNNDIFKDSLNNSLSHYIQEEKWDEARKCIEEYKNKQNNNIISFKTENFNELEKMGYKNFWYYYGYEENIDDYCRKIEKILM